MMRKLASGLPSLQDTLIRVASGMRVPQGPLTKISGEGKFGGAGPELGLEYQACV